VARLISTTSDLEAKFKDKLKVSFMPVWQELKRDNVLSAVNLFKVDHEEDAKLSAFSLKESRLNK
jgi:hypothetical protein